MYLSRAAEQVEAIQKRLDAGDDVTADERLDALTGLVNSLTACLAVVALKLDQLAGEA
jgi:hypothetical protein